jgi:hypothetical protein
MVNNLCTIAQSMISYKSILDPQDAKPDGNEPEVDEDYEKKKMETKFRSWRRAPNLISRASGPRKVRVLSHNPLAGAQQTEHHFLP